MRKVTMKSTSKFIATFMLSVASVGMLGVIASPVAIAQDKPKDAPKVSKNAAKPLKAAQEAMQAKNYDEALAKLKEAQGVSGLTPYDQHLMNEMFGFVYVRQQNYAEAAKALEAGLNSGYLEESEKPQRIKALAQVNYQIKNYDKAIEFGNRAIKDGIADEDMYTLVGQAYYIKGDYQGAMKFIDGWVDKDVKAGKTPKEQPLQLIMSSCVKLDDGACTQKALERMVAYYPKTEYWQNLLYSMFQSPEAGQDKSLLHVYRLASEVDVLKRPEDYTEMAQLAIEQGSPGEAVRVLEKGFAKNVFAEQRDKDRNQRLLESAKKQAATDQASLPKLEKDVASSKTGDRDVGLGLAYYSYEQYGKAAESFNRGLTKGGVRNEPETRLLLGISQLKSGAKDDATKTFQSVKGNGTLERLANLWTLHAKQAPAQTASVK
jgi:tetratricopeptide (TPR) repeat protein